MPALQSDIQVAGTMTRTMDKGYLFEVTTLVVNPLPLLKIKEEQLPPGAGYPSVGFPLAAHFKGY